MLQALIFIFTGSAIFLVGLKDVKWRRLGFIIALCAQPLWFIEMYMAKQWGIFALVFVFTAGWANGLRNTFGADLHKGGK